MAFVEMVPSLSGEILSHFYTNNNLLAQKLTKLEQFKENLLKFQKEIAQHLNNICLSIHDHFTYTKQCISLLISKLINIAP